MAKSTIIIIISVTAIVAVLGGWLWLSNEPATPEIPIGTSDAINNNLNSKPATDKTPATTTAAQLAATAAATTTIDEDLADIETQIIGLDNDNASVESALNDTSDNISK